MKDCTHGGQIMMLGVFQKIACESLDSQQKESYTFQKASAVPADHGFITIKPSDDWHGADFIAQHFHVDIRIGKLYLAEALKITP